MVLFPDGGMEAAGKRSGGVLFYIAFSFGLLQVTWP